MRLESRKDFARFMTKVRLNKETGCWEWTAARAPEGYGRFWLGGRMHLAHRVSYHSLVGETDAVLDHKVCDNPPCCNPRHLAESTIWENAKRGNSAAATQARKTHCKYGHPFSGDNLILFRGKHRRCRTCELRLKKIWWDKRGRDLRRRKYGNAGLSE